MSSAKSPIDASARSPLAGCTILIAAVLVMVFLIGFSVLTLFRQFNEIAKFTAEKPVALEVSPLENQEAALNALAERIETFRQQLVGDGEATLALTPDELNLAIAAYAPFKDLRGTFRVMSAEGENMRIAISFPLNGKPRLTRDGETGWITSDPRFLNGTLVARPALLKREVVLLLDDLKVSGSTVPTEFIGQMSPYRIAERYLTHPDLGPAMGKLTRVGIADGRLILSRTPGETRPDTIADEQVNKAGTRFFTILGVAACGFLVIAGLIIAVGLRSKSRRLSE